MSSAAYVMGHNDRERRRLALQATILAPLTEQFLVRAGIGSGMTVLDLGCGVGDVTLIAAQLVGPGGRVIAVDMDEAALAVAEARTRADGFDNVSFVSGRIDEYRPDGAHAVVGRHILIHAPDPLATLRHARGILHDGGVAAFQEFDFSYFPTAFPPFAYRDRVCAVFTDFFGRIGRADTGGRLYSLFVEAGFPSPDCRGEFAIHGGGDHPSNEWVAESLRSILPRAQALGIGLEFVDTIDTVAERLRQEAAARGSSLPSPVMVGAFARKS
jgi:ubiquinone/menaquinone biosynthesis C-methylase UbiE